MRETLRHWINRLGLLEAAVLTSLLLVAGSIWVFAELADEVQEGDSQRFDDWVMHALRDEGDLRAPIGPRWIKEVALDCTALGSRTVITLVCLGAAGFLALRRKWSALVLVVVAIGGGGIVSTLLKSIFERERPHLDLHLTEVTSLSFPSGHSMLAAVTYLTLGSVIARTTADRRLKWYILGVAVALTIIVGVTRVYLGVHYPTDVVAGWFAGLSWALLCSLVARWLQKHGTIEAESPAAPARSR